MSSRDLFRAIGQIDDDLIESANKTPVKHTIPLQFRHFVPAAACFCLVLLGAAMVSQDRSAGVSQAAETADLNESAPAYEESNSPETFSAFSMEGNEPDADAGSVADAPLSSSLKSAMQDSSPLQALSDILLGSGASGSSSLLAHSADELYFGESLILGSSADVVLPASLPVYRNSLLDAADNTDAMKARLRTVLDALGLDVPRTWDELAEVAKAFVTRDPDGNGENDTIGILGPGNSDHMNAVGGNQFGLDPLFSCFQSYPQYWLKSEDGSVEYGSIQPETKTALENISKLYADGVIDPETLVRSDSKEPLLAGKVGIFFGPWWCAYTFADTTLSGSADWRAYFTPLSEDGKYYTHMAEPTTQYVVASKDCKNPEAAFKIINYLVANEQKWVEEGVTSTEMGTGDFYPLYNTYDNADEIEKSYEALTKYLAGDISMDDVDFSTHKLLKNDMEAVTKLKKKPYDDFSLKYWNLDSDLAKTNLPRLVAIMVGDAPLVNEEYVPVYNAYNGQTETMEAKWANLKKMEEETFAKIIMGKADISEFDTFVKNWKNQGGDQILKEINDELSK